MHTDRLPRILLVLYRDNERSAFSAQLNILQYLEETRPNRPLMPADPIKRARVREICEVIASGIQPLQNLIVLIYVGEERKKEWAQHWITRGFTGNAKTTRVASGVFRDYARLLLLSLRRVFFRDPRKKYRR